MAILKFLWTNLGITGKILCFVIGPVIIIGILVSKFKDILFNIQEAHFKTDVKKIDDQLQNIDIKKAISNANLSNLEKEKENVNKTIDKTSVSSDVNFFNSDGSDTSK